MWIDDLQWADADSMVLLEELLAAPQPPVMLTLPAFRSEEVAAKPFLRRCSIVMATRMVGGDPVEPMADAEADALIAGLLPADVAVSETIDGRMTREALGSPFVLEQLALSKGVTARPARPADVSRAARRACAGGARFLETLAICGRPMAPEIVCDACELPTSARRWSCDAARLSPDSQQRLVGSRRDVSRSHSRSARGARGGRCGARRSSSNGARRSSRGRATTVRRCSSTIAAPASWNGRHAGGSLGREGQRRAGLRSRGLVLSSRARSGTSPPAAPAWRKRWPTALANAGRPAEAAEEYLRAAEGADRARRVELQRRAAEQFLTGGHIDKGLDLIRACWRAWA